MQLKNFYPILIPLILFLLLAYFLKSCKEASNSKPHIILCMADDQGWGDVEYYGHPFIQTPNLNELASSGLRFDQFYAAAPVCSPTRGSVLTGRHPNRFGCFSWGNVLRPQEITLAEALSTAGYVTGHFGKWHLGSVQKGSPVNPGASGFNEWFSAPNYFDNDPVLSREGIAVQTQGESSMVTVDAAVDFIRKHAGSEQPVFAVVWFGSPHLPFEAANEDSALYAGQSPKLANYYGEITGIDRAMGKLRNALKEMEIADNTLFWYCSDNGGYKGVSATGGRAHKGEIYEGGLRIPAIIEWPAKIASPGITDIPSNTSDIYPTLLEIAGVEMENQPPLDGISLLTLIEDDFTSRPEPIGFWKYTGGGKPVPGYRWMVELLEAQNKGEIIVDSARLNFDAAQIASVHPVDSFPGHAAWLEWPYKLHRIQSAPDDVKIELYNLARDSMEQNDISENEIAKVDTMLDRLEEWQKSVIHSLNGGDYR